MSDSGEIDGHAQDLTAELSPLYSEACQSFVLRDFDATASIVNDLLDRTERDGLGLDSDDDLNELVRRIWILQITLLASADEELARNPKQAERGPAGLYNRIEQFYARTADTAARPAASSSTTSPTTLVHPSLLVAISLAGLKLDIPLFVRRTLQDYFRLLLAHAATSEAALSASQGDISTLDASQADLSLSGIAVNGHATVTGRVNGTNGHLGVNGTSTPMQGGSSVKGSRVKSLHRLTRIYSINLLGKALGDWSAARAWIKEQRDDDAAIAANLISEAYAQTLLETLEETRQQQEEEELEARQAEKQAKDRQADSAKKNKQRTSSASATSGSKSNTPTGADGQAPPMRPERSEERTSGSPTETIGNAHVGPSSTVSRRTGEEQETGFAAFRSHLSSFLSTSDSSDPTSSISNRRPGGHLSHNSNSSNNSFDLIRIYLSKIVHSRLLKFLLAFFIVTGFWRRRMARSTGKGTMEIGRAWRRLRDKVLETVKMGGSLGFL